MSQPNLPTVGAQDGNVRVHDKRSGISRYGDIGHALVKRTKEKRPAHHSQTLAGQPTVPAPHKGQRKAGSKPLTPAERRMVNNALKRLKKA